MTSSCTKIEGPGGAATITGKLYIEEYDGAGNLINEHDAQKFDVYIIYGNEDGETYFDDDIETSYDGTYRFNFLEPGNYQIFFYEDHTFAEIIANPDLSKQKKVILKQVTITDKKEVHDLGTTVIYERN